MSKALSRSVVWRFDGADETAIWESLADTARFNEAAALPRHTIVEEPQPDGSVRYFGAAKVGPFRLRWEDLPVNWVTNRWFEHARYFQTGPLASLIAHFELDRDAAGLFGRYTITSAPAGPLGWAMLHSGTFFRGAFKNFSKLAKDAHQFALGQRDEPFQHPPPMLPKGAQARIDEAVARIEATPFGHGLARKLGDFIRSAQDVDMMSIRPLALARRWNAPPSQAIDLCLQAVKSGLLDMQWNILCPRCRAPKEVASGLDSLPTGAHCGTCNVDYGRDFAKNVEAVFRPAASIRPIGGGEYCLFGPMSAPHVRLHVTMPANATRDVPASFEPGPYRLRTLEPGDERDIEIDGEMLPLFRIDAGGAIEAGAIDTDAGGEPGRMRLVNDSTRPRTFIVESRHWVADALTADRITTRQTFRDLFSAETLRPGDDVGIQRIVLMFTDLKGSTALYERVGDAAAYHLVRDHFAFLAATVREHDGALIKTIGDAVMAAFSDPADAMRAALAIQCKVADFNKQHRGDDIVIKLGLHCGPTIAVTLNERLDYFGGTVNMAARLQGESRGGDIVLSDAMLEDRDVVRLLEDLAMTTESARLKGFDRAVPFRRVEQARLAAG
ncbi:MAG: adenylate/guanylate cyclase domain-containing protein [Dongiaceae bacterium]